MSSNHVEDLLTEYIDGNLVGATFDRVKSHLVFCTSCRQLHQDILVNISKLKAIPTITPTKELEQRILKALAEKSVPFAPVVELTRPSWTQWFLSFRGMSLAGAAVLLVFVVQNAPKMVRDSDKTEPAQALKALPKKKEASPSAPEFAANPIVAKDTIAPREEAAEPAMHRAKVSKEDPSFGGPVPPIINQAVGGARADTAVSSFKSIPSEKSKEVTDNQSISGTSSGITQPLEKVISDRKTWEDYWNRHQKGANEKSSLPEVDFEKNEIIAVFAGNQPTAGFRIEITRVLLTQWENAPARVVRYQLSGPPEGAMAATVVTQPFCFKIVPKAAGATFFRKIR